MADDGPLSPLPPGLTENESLPRTNVGNASQPQLGQPGQPQPGVHPHSNGTNASSRTHRRTGAPGLQWHITWGRDRFKNGRVLLIDYVSKDHSPEGRRRIVAQEFEDIDGLRKFYQNNDHASQAALRVIHVQCAPWATRFLLRKFNIDASNDIAGSAFGTWVKSDRPRLRGGKPLLDGKTFRTQRDPWRGISRTAFGLDYLRQYKPKASSEALETANKVMELNGWNDDTIERTYEVFAQRLGVYIQSKDAQSAVDPDLDHASGASRERQYEKEQQLKRMYGDEAAKNRDDGFVPKLATLDNSNAIIVFENAYSGSVFDTLIGARQEIEARWRRLTFYLPREDTPNDEKLASECSLFIMKDIFTALAYGWQKYLACCSDHVGILEEQVYDWPADESRAVELWTTSRMWLRVEKLIDIHIDIIKDMRVHMTELTEDDSLTEWSSRIREEFENVAHMVHEDLIAPTAALNDLMYRSVAYRDSRISIKQGASMWRLSWITFIFLPLTFLVGFFGMNVDTFQQFPSIKYYFIALVCIMAIVIALWYCVKHSLSEQHQNRQRRGIYTSFYRDLATQHPQLWTAGGPRENVIPQGFLGRIKWRLLNQWFAPRRLVPTGAGLEPDASELGMWSRLRQRLAWRWLPTIHTMSDTSRLELVELGEGDKDSAGNETTDHLMSQTRVVDIPRRNDDEQGGDTVQLTANSTSGSSSLEKGDDKGEPDKVLMVPGPSSERTVGVQRQDED